jgi:hypothetical protein
VKAIAEESGDQAGNRRTSDLEWISAGFPPEDRRSSRAYSPEASVNQAIFRRPATRLDSGPPTGIAAEDAGVPFFGRDLRISPRA